MRRFRFSLETVLRVRRHTEDLACRRLAEAEHRVRQQETRLAGVDRLIAQTQNDLRRAGEDPTTAQSLHAYIRYLNRLAEDRQETLSALARRREEHEQRRHERAEAGKQVRMLERLRERQYREWLAHADKVEREILDEIGARRHLRRRQAGRAMTTALLVLFMLITVGALIFYLTPCGQNLLRIALPQRQLLDFDRMTSGAGGGSSGGVGVASQGPASQLPAATDVLSLPAEELSRVLGDAQMMLKQRWDEMGAWQERLDARARKLDEQQATLAAWQEELEQAAGVINASYAELERRLERTREAEAQAKRDRYDIVAKTVRSMDAREAAQYLVEAPEDLAYNVLSRLSDRTRGEIFSELPRVASSEDGARLMALLSRTEREHLKEVVDGGP